MNTTTLTRAAEILSTADQHLARCQTRRPENAAIAHAWRMYRRDLADRLSMARNVARIEAQRMVESAHG